MTYPTRSLQILAEADRLLQALRRDVAGIADPVFFGAGAPVLRVCGDGPGPAGPGPGRRGGSADRGGTALAAAARDRQSQAQSNRLEADRRLAEARAALAGRTSTPPRNVLNGPGSGTWRPCPSRRIRPCGPAATSDLQALGIQIVRAENDRVVRDTRRLLTEGKAFYNAGDFARAEEALLQARARWKVTHTDEPEPEVENWLRLVQTALSVKTGRDIPQTAPLYPEMSQLLSLGPKEFRGGPGGAGAGQGQRPAVLRRGQKAYRRGQAGLPPEPGSPGAGTADQPGLGPGRLQPGVCPAGDPGPGQDRRPAGTGDRLQRPSGSPDDRPGGTQPGGPDRAPGDPDRPAPTPAGPEGPGGGPHPDRRGLSGSGTPGTIGQFSIALARLNQALQLDPNNQSASSLKDRILTYVGGDGGGGAAQFGGNPVQRGRGLPPERRLPFRPAPPHPALRVLSPGAEGPEGFGPGLAPGREGCRGPCRTEGGTRIRGRNAPWRSLRLPISRYGSGPGLLLGESLRSSRIPPPATRLPWLCPGASRWSWQESQSGGSGSGKLSSPWSCSRTASRRSCAGASLVPIPSGATSRSSSASSSPAGELAAAAVLSGEREATVLVSRDGGLSFPLTAAVASDLTISAPRIFHPIGGGWYLFAARGREDTLTIYFARTEDGRSWTEFRPFVNGGTTLPLSFLPSAASVPRRRHRRVPGPVRRRAADLPASIPSAPPTAARPGAAPPL
ncbi:MAG: hypothetical protein MZV70_22395 [Desulfobacterales bacterium]|nr:hypothetical protein [Desulfobacterales bacterium]